MRVDPIRIEAQGLDQVASAIKLLEETLGPRSYDGVELLDTGRDDGALNTEILLKQRDLFGRDVVTAGDKEVKEIGQAYVDRIIAEVDNVLNRQATGKKTTGRESAVVDRLALTDAIKKYMEIITTRIEKKVNASGSPLKKLSPGYAAWKLRVFGFVEPILKASGQLLDVLNPTAKGNIKFTKGSR